MAAEPDLSVVINSVPPVEHKMTIKTANGVEAFTTSYPPLEVTYGGFEGQFEEIARPGRKPLLRKSGQALRTISMTLLVFGGRLESKSADDQLLKLQRLANARLPVVIEYEPRTDGNWMITSLSYDSQMRELGTSHVARAEVQIEFTEYIDKLMVQKEPGKGGGGGGNGGGGGGNGGGGGGSGNKKVTYTVRKGDTLYSIAKKFYGDADRWKVIAKANDIKDPRKLKVGKVIKIPSIKLERVE